MKFYVDKKPKNCEECPFLHDDRWCLINWYEIYTPDKVKSFENGCPLQSLADYTKQVRKEAFEELYKFCEEHHFSKYSIDEFLDQIQGESK